MHNAYEIHSNTHFQQHYAIFHCITYKTQHKGFILQHCKL